MRLTIRSVMIAVAIVAVVLAANVEEPGGGDPVVAGLLALLAPRRVAASAPIAGVALVAACVSVLAGVRFADVLRRRRAEGPATSRPPRGVLLLKSAAAAVSIIGLSDLVFLAGYHGYMACVTFRWLRTHWTPYLEESHIRNGAVTGIVLALAVASLMRKTSRPAGGRATRAATGSPPRGGQDACPPGLEAPSLRETVRPGLIRTPLRGSPESL